MADPKAHNTADAFHWQTGSTGQRRSHVPFPSRAPDSPNPTAYHLEDTLDVDRDDPELQLTRTDSHSEDPGNTGGLEPQASRTNAPPPTPRLPDLELDEVFVDDYQDELELQLSRSYSNSQDSANCVDLIDSRFDAELASLDSDGKTPTQSLFPPLPSRASTFLAPYRTAKFDRDDAAAADNMTATSPARSGVSPSSSPRLPSPPPFTEVQIGPKSPSVGDSNQNQLGDAARIDNGSTRRIRPGTKAADMEKGPPLVPLNEVCNLYESVLIPIRDEKYLPDLRIHYALLRPFS